MKFKNHKIYLKFKYIQRLLNNIERKFEGRKKKANV